MIGRARGFSARVEAATPAIGRFVATPQGPMHVVERGARHAPPLVMLHGASGNLRDFTSSIIDDLARRWRVVALDRPGHGWSAAQGPTPWRLASQVDAFQAALKALEIGRFAIFGHSYGVALSMAWAARLLAAGEGDRLVGVVAVSGGMIDWTGAAGWRYRLGRTPALGRLMGRLAPWVATDAFLKSELAEVFAPQPPPTDYVARAGVLLALRPTTFAVNIASMGRLIEETTPLRAALAHITAPVEVLNGDADQICAPSAAGPYAARTPNAALTWASGVGHMPHHVARPLVLAAAERARVRLVE